MEVLVALAGDAVDSPLLRRHVAAASLVIAADGGADLLAGLGIQPTVVTGDFDSIAPSTLERLRAEGVEVVAHPSPEQITDAYAALLLARDRGATTITLIGAHGGARLDHSLAALLYPLATPFRACRILLVDGRTEATILRGDGPSDGPLRSVRFQGTPGDYVSLVPLSASVEGVTTVGLAYPLVDATLELGTSRGVSNTLAVAEGGYTIRAGLALATHTVRD